jgi:hypothetical protein
VGKSFYNIGASIDGGAAKSSNSNLLLSDIRYYKTEDEICQKRSKELYLVKLNCS